MKEEMVANPAKDSSDLPKEKEDVAPSGTSPRRSLIDDDGVSEDFFVGIATERAESMQYGRGGAGVQEDEEGGKSDVVKDATDETTLLEEPATKEEDDDGPQPVIEETGVSSTSDIKRSATSGYTPTTNSLDRRNVSVGAIRIIPIGGRGNAAPNMNGDDEGQHQQPQAITAGTGVNVSESGQIMVVTADVVDEEANRRQYTNTIREEILRDAVQAEEVIPEEEDPDTTKKGVNKNNGESSSKQKQIGLFVGLIIVVVIIVVSILATRNNGKGSEDSKQDPSPPDDVIISDWEYLFDMFTTASNGGGMSSPLTDPEILLDETSPQYKALDWLTNVDTLYHDSNNDTASMSMIQSTDGRCLMERYAMAVLYYSTGGNNWIDDMKFLSNVTSCEWDGVSCNRQNRTITLEIDGNNLNGTIPGELKALRNLFHLSFYNNGVNGQLPESLGELSDLEELDLQVNLLTGTIPDSYEELRSMKNFWLYKNLLTGTIPDGLPKISSMEHFLLWDNMMVGSIPEFAINAAVRDINLLQNQFTGTLPESLYTLVRLENLYLGWNELEGSISSQIGALVNLNRVWFNTNSIGGSLPTEIGKLQSLSQARLQQNKLTGSLPAEIGNMENLQDMKLDSNILSGSIPSEIGNLAKLQSLSFHNNPDVVGLVPEEICNIGTIESIGADCGGENPTISCSCCTTCCNAATEDGDCAADVPQSCLNIARKYAAPANRGTTCECSSMDEIVGDDDGAVAPFVSQYCTDTTCETCNEDGTICGINLDYGLDFDENGNWMAFRGEFHYTAGRDDVVSYQIASSSFPDVEQYVSINGEKCLGNFASWVCANGLRGWVVECDNLGEDGVSIDTCQDPEPFGPLQFLFQNFDKQGCQTPIAPYCYWYQRNCIE